MYRKKADSDSDDSGPEDSRYQVSPGPDVNVLAVSSPASAAMREQKLKKQREAAAKRKERFQGGMVAAQTERPGTGLAAPRTISVSGSAHAEIIPEPPSPIHPEPPHWGKGLGSKEEGEEEESFDEPVPGPLPEEDRAAEQHVRARPVALPPIQSKAQAQGTFAAEKNVSSVASVVPQESPPRPSTTTTTAVAAQGGSPVERKEAPEAVAHIDSSPTKKSEPELAQKEEVAKSETEHQLEQRGIATAYDPREKPVASASVGLPAQVGTIIRPSDIFNFISSPGPRDSYIQCKIQRLSRGIGKVYPNYYLYLEETNQFLLAARKRKRSKSSNYLISTDQADLARSSGSFVGKVRANFVGTEFIVYDNGSNPRNAGQGDIRLELAAVTYGANVLGLQGPRRMHVLLPALNDQDEMIPSQPRSTAQSLLERCKAGNITNALQLANKTPVWNEETQSYVLNFHKRVKLASVKNFQLIFPEDPDTIIMQFGRVTDVVFSLDYRYPLNLLQAFGIALSSFDNKLACE